jgi:hypothetical protein
VTEPVVGVAGLSTSDEQHLGLLLECLTRMLASNHMKRDVVHPTLTLSDSSSSSIT